MTALEGPLPAIPASAGALIFDQTGRLLILKPVYKSGWTIPGGVMEADGRPRGRPARREVREECGLTVDRGRLACVDFRPPRRGKPGGMRFLFDCGPLPEEDLAAIVLQREEISRHGSSPSPPPWTCCASPSGGGSGPPSRPAAPGYLENGRPIPGVEMLANPPAPTPRDRARGSARRG